MSTDDVNLATSGRRMVVDILLIILKAGYDVIRLDILGALITLVFVSAISCIDLTWTLSSARGHANQFQLISLLVNLLLIHRFEAVRKGDDFYCYELILGSAVRVKTLRESSTTDSVGSLDAYNSIIGSLGDMFRYLVFAGVNCNNGRFYLIENRLCRNCFISLSGCSNQFGQQSECLARLVLNVSNADQINKLQKVLSETLKDSSVEEVRKATSDAIELIRGVGTPLSLQHLSRWAIIRTMGRRTLYGNLTLRLPRLIIDYVLLKK